MDEKKTTSQYSLIAGILFGIFALKDLSFCIQIFNYRDLIGRLIIGVLFLIASAALAVLFITKKSGIFMTAVLGCLTLLQLWQFIDCFKLKKDSTLWFLDYWSGYTFGGEYNSFVVFLYLLVTLAHAGLFCIAAANYTTWLHNYKQMVNRLWFLPPAMMLARVILGFFAMILSEFFGIMATSYAYFDLRSVFFILLMAAAMLFAGLAIVFPDGLPKSNLNVVSAQTEGENQKMATNTSGVTSEAYCSLVNHILLLLFTFGIWQFIWIYRMTEYTNAVQDEEPRNPTNKLLLSLFVPFYIIYWTYKTAQRVDKMAATKGLTSDMATLCLILEIFVPIIPPILLQDKMNNIITAGDARPAAAPKAQKTNNDATLGTAEELKTYKELLDSGVITQEEFDAKKKQLLGL